MGKFHRKALETGPGFVIGLIIFLVLLFILLMIIFEAPEKTGAKSAIKGLFGSVVGVTGCWIKKE